MSEIVELSTLDLRYEGHRLRDDAREARLLASIAERGIEEPLEGVDTSQARFLLDGFKRRRSAEKLGIDCVPYVSLGQEEATAILSLMRGSTDKALGILEQARFLVDLLTVHEMSVAEVAQTLSRSKGWVSMRQSLLEEMSPAIQETLFRGAFPVYSYMYTLRPFMRMNSVTADEIERFMKAVAGRRLSVRDIELLAHGYFRGPASLREAIDGGKLGWSLDQMKRVPEDRGGCSEFERVLLNDLQSLQKSMQRVMAKCHDPERYGFQFLCHAIRHPNRKAGEERSFWTVQTNFLPGRSFQSLEDLNQQAFQWATVRMAHRPVSKTGLIPAKAFEHERSYLTELPSQLPAPYWPQERGTDEYGYASFEGNYYWVPGSKREDVKVLRYADRLKIYQHRICVAEYPLPADGIKNARFSPEGQPAPRHLPKHRKHGSQQEEQRLRALGPEVAAYVDYALRTPGIQRHRFLRELFALSRKVTLTVFVEALGRALRYRVVQMETLERIAWLCMSQGQEPLPYVDVDESFRQRPAYEEGFLTDEPDLSIYDETVREDDATDSPESEDHDG